MWELLCVAKCFSDGVSPGVLSETGTGTGDVSLIDGIRVELQWLLQRTRSGRWLIASRTGRSSLFRR